jgi:hypothetical protein
VRASVSSCARVLSQMKSIRCVVYPWPAMTPSYHLSSMHSQVRSAEACFAVATSGVQTHFERDSGDETARNSHARRLRYARHAMCRAHRYRQAGVSKNGRWVISFSPVRAPLWPSPPAPSRFFCPVACPRSCGAPNRPAVRGSAGKLPFTLTLTKPSTPPSPSFASAPSRRDSGRGAQQVAQGEACVQFGSVRDHERA